MYSLGSDDERRAGSKTRPLANKNKYSMTHLMVCGSRRRIVAGQSLTTKGGFPS